MALKKLSERENSFILVWSGTEPLELYCDGSSFFVPPRDQVADPSVPGGIYRYPSATDRAGQRMIPGTIVVRDVYGIKEGQSVRLFEAYELVKFVERTRKELMARGLAIVEKVEDVEEAHSIGIPAFAKSQDARAKDILEKELKRRKNAEDRGVPPGVSSSEEDVIWARHHLEGRHLDVSAVSTDDIRSVLSGSPAPPTGLVAPMRASSAPRATAVTDGTELYTKAKALGLKLLKEQLEGLLAGDPETVSDVKKIVDEKMAILSSVDEAP